MFLVYIDDSRDEKLCVFSALAIEDVDWQNSFESVRLFRRNLKKTDGIYIYKELHTWELVSGRGRISERIVPKGRRCQIFMDALTEVAKLPGARLFNAVFGAKDDERAFERLLNRINRTMEKMKSYAVIVCDEGKESAFTRLARRMHVYNPIPSKYGVWRETGLAMKNITIDRVLEDPFFKKSDKSYFIQLADACAYALLRREHPIASKTKYGIDRAFSILSPILVREASRKDEEGIIRP